MSEESAPGPSADVALLTDRRYESDVASEDDWYLGNILADDGLLRAALLRRGLTSARIDWSRKDVDWSRFRCAVFRTTWDYFDRFGEFTDWLGRVQSQTLLINSAPTVRWNLDKHYLADLRSRGVPVVETVFVERGDSLPLADWLARLGWARAVVKPCVSGAARHTYRLDRENADEVDATVRPLLATEAFMLQPFQESVVRHGEDTLVLFDGKFTHAVRKVAGPGDFRVQDDFGGTVHDLRPAEEQIELAARAMSECPSPPAYGRADLVRDNQGRWAIMELEVIEPELWLRRCPAAAGAFAGAIIRRLNNT